MTRSTRQRKDEILSRLHASGHVDVKSLASGMAVSEATVRRDLRSLADEGHIELVYGGATLPRSSDVSISARTLRNMDAKRVVGALAGNLVRDHEMLYVDGGTTCFEMRTALKARRGISVIVNSWRWAVELSGVAGINIVQIGGHYRPEREDCVGPLAAQSIDQLRGYVAFICADGLDTDYGLWSNDIETAYLYQHVVRNARETVLVVDHSKFQSPSLYRICGWENISRVVTDRLPPEHWVSFLEQRGTALHCPDRPDEAQQ